MTVQALQKLQLKQHTQFYLVGKTCLWEDISTTLWTLYCYLRSNWVPLQILILIVHIQNGFKDVSKGSDGWALIVPSGPFLSDFPEFHLVITPIQLFSEATGWDYVEIWREVASIDLWHVALALFFIRPRPSSFIHTQCQATFGDQMQVNHAKLNSDKPQVINNVYQTSWHGNRTPFIDGVQLPLVAQVHSAPSSFVAPASWIFRLLQ